jgi:hypothetical protein
MLSASCWASLRDHAMRFLLLVEEDFQGLCRGRGIRALMLKTRLGWRLGVSGFPGCGPGRCGLAPDSREHEGWVSLSDVCRQVSPGLVLVRFCATCTACEPTFLWCPKLEAARLAVFHRHKSHGRSTVSRYGCTRKAVKQRLSTDKEIAARTQTLK